MEEKEPASSLADSQLSIFQGQMREFHRLLKTQVSIQKIDPLTNKVRAKPDPLLLC